MKSPWMWNFFFVITEFVYVFHENCNYLLYTNIHIINNSLDHNLTKQLIRMCSWRNWVFGTNSNFLILISETLGCKDIGIRKSKFVAKTQFLWTRGFILYRVTHKTNFRDGCKGMHNVCFLILTIPCNLKFLSFFATTHYLSKKSFRSSLKSDPLW